MKNISKTKYANIAHVTLKKNSNVICLQAGFRRCFFFFNFFDWKRNEMTAKCDPKKFRLYFEMVINGLVRKNKYKHIYRRISTIGRNFYLLYVEGETTFSGGCLFTFGLTLLTCLMEFICAFGCWAFSCWLEPVKPPLVRRLRFITERVNWIKYYFLNAFVFCLRLIKKIKKVCDDF